MDGNGETAQQFEVQERSVIPAKVPNEGLGRVSEFLKPSKQREKERKKADLKFGWKGNDK